MENTVENVETFYCRLCAELTPANKLFNLLTDTDRTREVVSNLARLKHEFINMFRDNVMPKTICFLCLDSLYRSVAFVDKIESSQVVLKDIFAIKSIKHEPKELLDAQCNNDDNSLVKQERDNDSSSSSCTSDSEPAPRRTYRRRYSDDNMSWNDYQWMCAFCSTYFQSAEDLMLHSMEYHDSCTAYKCIDCNIRKLKLDPFLAHISRHRKYLKRHCYMCNYRYTKNKDAEKHRSLHVKYEHICAGCHTSFQTIEELEEHKQKYYTDKRATRSNHRVSESELICDICDKKFKTRSILQSHLLIHTDRRRDHTCDICGKCFYNKDTLMSHLVVHADKRPYQCEICKFAFKTIGQLRMHVGTHDGEKPFACDQCGKRFRLRKNLTSHLITHTDSLPYVCEICSKAFRFKTILNQHIRQHTGVKPYSCQVCSRAFTNWSNYNKHMKRRHGMEMAKKKHTDRGVFPINPLTGEVIITPLPVNAEEWKKSVLQRKLVRKPDRDNVSTGNNVVNENIAHNSAT